MGRRAGTHPTFVHIHGKETACFKRLYRSWRSYGKCGKRLSGMHTYSHCPGRSRRSALTKILLESYVPRAMRRFTSNPGKISRLGLRLEQLPAG